MQRNHQQKSADKAQTDAGEEDHGKTRSGDHQRRTEVRLAQNKRNGDHHHDEGGEVHPQAVAPGGEHLVIIAREGDRHRDLHQFGRLQAQGTKLQPALGAVHDDAAEIDHDQHDHADRVGRIGDRRP